MEDFEVKKLSNGDFEIEKIATHEYLAKYGYTKEVLFAMDNLSEWFYPERIEYDPESIKVLQNLEPARKRPTQHIIPDET